MVGGAGGDEFGDAMSMVIVDGFADKMRFRDDGANGWFAAMASGVLGPGVAAMSPHGDGLVASGLCRFVDW